MHIGFTRIRQRLRNGKDARQRHADAEQRKDVQRTATLITNFDSTEQLREWNEIVRQACEGISSNADEKASGHIDVPRSPRPWTRTYDPNHLWLMDDANRPCRHLLNDEPAFATHFAGVARTAFLYCPRILLTDAQLFDGLFFLALGPTTVNGILGKSYKDGPAIVISGRSATMEECFMAFTVTTVRNVRNKMMTSAHRPSKRTGRTEHEASSASSPFPSSSEEQDLITIRPLEYSALAPIDGRGITISPEDSLRFASRHAREFTERLDRIERQGARLCGETRAQVVAEMFATYLIEHHDEHAHGPNGTHVPNGTPEGASKTNTSADHRGENAKDRCRLLAQRWQQWIDAVKDGSVLYVNQNSAEELERRGNVGFEDVFNDMSERYASPLRALYDLQSPKQGNAANATDFLAMCSKALDAIAAEPNRSDAFAKLNSIFPTPTPSASSTPSPSASAPALSTSGPSAPPSTTSSQRGRNRSNPSVIPPLTRDLLRDWYQFVYQQTLAIHLGAYLISVNTRPNSFAQLLTDRNDRSTLMLSGPITAILANMPYTRFATLCYECRSTIQAWRACTPAMSKREQKTNTSRMAYSIGQAGQEKSLPSEKAAMLWTLVIAFALALGVRMFFWTARWPVQGSFGIARDSSSPVIS